MDNRICFYDRVLVQKSNKYTILYNANFKQLAKVTTEIYEVIYTICRVQICFDEVIIARTQMKKISVSRVITKDTSDKKQDFINFLSQY